MNWRAPSLQPLRQLRCHTDRVSCSAWDVRIDAGAGSPQSPHAPPSDVEGDLWGDLQAVSWMAGSPLPLLNS